MAVRDKKKQTETGFITAGDRYLFGEGTHYEITINLVPTQKRSMAKPAIISLYGLPMPHPSV